MPFAQQDVGCSDPQDTGLYSLRPLDDGVECGARGARAGKPVAVARIMEDNKSVSVTVGLLAV
jgi:hypothetical protein